jgi:hypothetical protein
MSWAALSSFFAFIGPSGSTTSSSITKSTFDVKLTVFPQPSWIHIPCAWFAVPTLLHDDWPGSCGNGAKPRDCSNSLQRSLLICSHFVSHSYWFKPLISSEDWMKQRNSATLPPTRMVEMDVPIVTVYLPGVGLARTRYKYMTNETVNISDELTAVGHHQINCSPVEFVLLNPPSGTTCGDYMKTYISYAGGYLANSAASSKCQFCSTRTTDEFLGNNFNIRYSEHWWHLGLFAIYIIFNVSLSHLVSDTHKTAQFLTRTMLQIFATFALTWLFRVRTRSLRSLLHARLR